MATIANWLNERYQVKMVDKIVEDTHTDLVTEDPVLNEYAPTRTYNDRNFLGMVVEKIRPIASVIGYGGKAPTTQAGSFRQVVQKFAKIGLDYVFDEELQFRMEEVQRYAAYQGIMVQDRVLPNGEVVPGSGNQLSDFIFGKAQDLVTGVQTVVDNFAWQILQFGQITYTDPRTNITLSIDYKDAGATYNFFPAAGAAPVVDGANFDAGGRVSWDDYTNANGILDIELDCEAYRKVNGTYPKAVVMSRTLLRHLIRQTKTIDYAATFSTGLTAAKMSNVILTRILEDRGLPPIVIHDRLYDQEANSGVITKARFLAENRYCFLAPNTVERAWGTTIESKAGLYDAPKAGIYLTTKPHPTNDATDVMSARATCLALCVNPKPLLARQCIYG